MNEKIELITDIIKIITGVLAATVFFQGLFNGTKVTVMIVAFALMVMGLSQGSKGVYDRLKRR